MAIEAGFFLAGPIAKGAARLIGSVFMKGKKFKIVNYLSSTVLGQNLELLGSFKCSGCQAHHLIPGNMQTADAARQILARYHININSPLNGVWLPGRYSPAEWAGAVHNGRHFDEYGRMVSRRIQAADARAGLNGVIEELQRIRNELFEDGGVLASYI